MIRGLKTYPLLTGFRGSQPCDVGALQDIVVRVSCMAEEIPEIAELDLNPVIVHATGAVVVDGRVRVAPVRASDAAFSYPRLGVIPQRPGLFPPRS